MMCQFSCSGDGDKVPNQLGLRSVHKAQRAEHTVSHRGSTPHTHWEVRGEREEQPREGGKAQARYPNSQLNHQRETTGDEEEPSRSMRDPQQKENPKKKEKPKEGRERRNFRAGRSGEPPELRQPSQEINEIDDVNTRSSAIGYATESKRYV